MDTRGEELLDRRFLGRQIKSADRVGCDHKPFRLISCRRVIPLSFSSTLGVLAFLAVNRPSLCGKTYDGKFQPNTNHLCAL
jgi:hypothetical protein